MATSIKISQLPAKGSNLEATDLLEVSEFNGTGYVSKSITGAEILGGATTGFVPYVGATQDLELGANELYTGKLWLYDAVNDNYGSTHYTDGNYHIEDADGHKLLVIEDGFMQIHKTDTIQSNLFTSGLTAIRDHYLPDASGTIALTSDLSGYVPTSRTLTINGTTQDLSANRTFTVSTGITIGTTAITSGTVGRVLFEGTGNVVQESANLVFDNTTSKLTVTGQLAVTGLVTLTNNIEFNSYNRLIGTGSFPLSTIYVGTVRSISTILSSGGTTGLSFGNNGGTTQMQIRDNGNVLINTTTDAGFKLDVNGTLRVQGNLTVASGSNFVLAGSSNAFSSPSFALWGGGTGVINVSNGGYGVLSRMNFGANAVTSIPSLAINTNELIVRDGNNGVATSFGVGVSSTMNASAKMQIDSTTQGFLPPRMTTTQKNAIATPATGLMVYDTTLNLISVYNGTTWITL